MILCMKHFRISSIIFFSVITDFGGCTLFNIARLYNSIRADVESWQRYIMIIAWLFIGIMYVNARNQHIIVADSITHFPLPNASIFNNKGTFIGTSKVNGTITCASNTDYPITVRYMGYHERTIPDEYCDTIFLIENLSELPEVIVEAKQQRMLHVLAYVREYSTLTSYTDTITMFREKMVDFMLPTDAKTHFKGWRYPRLLNTRSYYQFTNANGLDSVSDRCSLYFTWSDWIGLIPTIQIPPNVANTECGTYTVSGKYSPTEIWLRNGDRLVIDVNVMADTMGRKWVPTMSHFFKNDDADFEQFKLKINYDNVISDEAGPLELTGYSYNIESRGRGRGMFQFNRQDQPFFVTTYAEVYILDKEFITVKEAKKWDNHNFSEDIGILKPAEAPVLSPYTLALIDRVNNIDADQVRLSIKPDERLMSRNTQNGNFGIGHRALFLLKQLTGITYYKSHKKFNRRWNDFRDSRKKQTGNQDTTQ